MIPLLLATAFADPSALRAPGQPAVAVEVGAPVASVAGWSGDRGIGGWVRTDLGSAGLALALRRGPESGFGLVGHAATGLLVTFPRPGLGLHASLAGGIGRTGDRAAHRLQVVLPVSAANGAIRLPVLIEGASSVAIGSLRVGGRGAIGAVWTVDQRPALALQGGLVLSRD